MNKLAVGLAALAAPVIAFGANPSAQQPNIVFLLVDDLGWADVGYQNATVKVTPNVDRLASEGMVFSSFYAAPVCSPSRGAILTGRSPASLKLTSHIPGVGFEKYYDGSKKMLSNTENRLWEAAMIDRLHLNEVTIAEALKAGGYKTAFFGKWHLAGAGSQKTSDGVVNKAWHPQHHGFDINIGGCAYGQPAGKAYFSPYKNAELSDGPEGEYLTDRLANETVKFMKENKDKPFLAYLSFYTIHSPMNPKPEVNKEIKDRYLGMLACMDQAVGTVLKAVDEFGLRKNTIVVFTSDNGGTRRQNPLRGTKGSVYEGGIRVPLIYRWPEKIEAGVMINTPVAACDFFPTLLEMVNVPIPKETKRLDGISYAPLLKGAKDYTPHPIYIHFPHHRAGNVFGGASAVRDGNWKLIWHQNADTYALYNLEKNIGETKDLAAEHPEKVASLKTLLANWFKTTEANMPRKMGGE